MKSRRGSQESDAVNHHGDRDALHDHHAVHRRDRRAPRVHVEFIDANSDAEAKRIVEDVAHDARKLMDQVVDGWRDYDELKDLGGDDLLDQYGIKFGVIEVWQGERTFAWVQPLATVGVPPPAPPDCSGLARPRGISRPPVA